jgi:hypothetical protein
MSVYTKETKKITKIKKYQLQESFWNNDKTKQNFPFSITQTIHTFLKLAFAYKITYGI